MSYTFSSQKMLNFEPNRRISAGEAMRHPYFSDILASPNTGLAGLNTSSSSSPGSFSLQITLGGRLPWTQISNFKNIYCFVIRFDLNGTQYVPCFYTLFWNTPMSWARPFCQPFSVADSLEQNAWISKNIYCFAIRFDLIKLNMYPVICLILKLVPTLAGP